MSYPPAPPPQPPVPQPAAAPRDNTTLFGILGIIFSCCTPLGVLFGVLALLEARRRGSSPTLAYVALGLTGLLLVIHIITLVAGNNPYRYQW